MIRRTVLPCTAAVALIAAGMVAVSGPAVAADTATINGATTYQTVAGFGASEGFGEADAVMNAPAAAQQQALGLLYSPTAGAGLTILRNEISADSGSTIEPTGAGQPDRYPRVQCARQRPGPGMVRAADQGGLRGDQRVRRRVERAGLHEDQ